MARFSSMIDMAKTADDVKKEIADYPSPVSQGKPSVPVYPYGLCLALEEDQLDKLGLSGDLPEVGEMIHIAAMAKVTSVSENEREMTDGSKKRCCRIELQITHLATENEDEEYAEERRKRFYGSDDGEAA